MTAEHIPVLFAEVLQVLAPTAGGSLLDGTLGLGGHSSGWLEGTGVAGEVGSVVGLDRDTHALAIAQDRLEGRFPGHTTYVHTSFERAQEAAATARHGPFDAALLDLGASSLQFDSPERGFSFRASGPLDMRMDPQEDGLTAADIVNASPESELVRIFDEYGDEPAARRVAKAVVAERDRAPFRDTLRLAETVAQATGGRRGKQHPATRVFQSLRVATNDEMGRLDRGLPAVAATVRVGGRMAVITFQRHEDRRVKRFFADGAREGRFRVLPSVTPSREEERINRRSRSARLRAVEVLRGESLDG
jgi:16S rRNA (cytosine1402-N4)-methyltransferase